MRIEGTDINLILKLYFEGKSINEIADIFYIKNPKKVSDGINYYIEQHPSIKAQYKKLRIKNIKNDDLYNLVKQGVSYKKISDIYNISESTVRVKINQYCKENEIPFDKIKENKNNKPKTNLPMDEIIGKFKNGKTIADLALEYNTCASTMSSHIRDILSENEVVSIINKNKHLKKSWFTQDELLKIRKDYESGEYTKNEIAKKKNISLLVLNRILKNEYDKIGKKSIPKIVSEKTFKMFMKDNKFNREQVLKYANDNDFVIPEKLISNYFKSDIDIEKIRRFVINSIINKAVSDDSQKEIFNNYNIAALLKNKGFNEKYQAVAILYSLPKLTNVNYDEINKVLNRNDDILEAIKLLNIENDKDKEYLKLLEENNFAKIVKIASYIEKIKKDTLNGIKTNIDEYRVFYEITKNTKLKSELELTLFENRESFKNNIQEVK